MDMKKAGSQNYDSLEGEWLMGNAVANKGAKWPEQIPNHILSILEQHEEDYSLGDVIAICEEIVDLYDQGRGMQATWNEMSVPNLMMSTVTFRNKFARYVK